MTTKPTKSKPAALTKVQLEKLAAFRYQLRRYLRFSEQLSRRHGLTPLQYQLLLQIEGFPKREWATVSELAERLQAKHNAVVSLVTRCEKLGLVTRESSSIDRREVHVRLTASGERRLAQLAGPHRAELKTLQRDLSLREMFADRDDESSAGSP
ncbi:MAG TPA: MarR family transcriptional regulator [Nevskiaceae bacterium]|nr:MarR family transcriptional regulator [Nevskiaceae bacterium]